MLRFLYRNGGAVDGRIESDADIPSQYGRIQVVGTNAFGRRWDIEANRRQSYIRLSPL